MVTLGAATSDRVVVKPLRRSYPGRADYWDGNWLACSIEVEVGGFHGRVDCDLRNEEFVRFRDGLRRLYNELTGEATFETMEGWLKIGIVGDGRGHLTATCELRDDPTFGNQLHYTLDFDQTLLPKVIESLDNIIDAFPVIGKT
jgi:hypothetical protein